jgi:hypothetical protein
VVDFALNLVRTLIWPTVAIVFLLVFRSQLGRFLEGLGSRVQKLSFAQISIELAVVPENKQLVVLNDLGQLTQGSYFLSGGSDLLKQIRSAEPYDYAIFDLKGGRGWLTSRLFIFATMLERMRGLRCCVFVDSSGAVAGSFVGAAAPSAVRWALAREYPWLERAYVQAYSAIFPEPAGNPPAAATSAAPRPHQATVRISSAAGALTTVNAEKLVLGFVNHPSVHPQDPASEPPEDERSQWVVLHMNGERFWEHAEWLTRSLLEDVLGDVLTTQAVRASVNDRGERVTRAVLRVEAPFVALVDRRGTFIDLVDRLALLEEFTESA